MMESLGGLVERFWRFGFGSKGSLFPLDENNVEVDLPVGPDGYAITALDGMPVYLPGSAVTAIASGTFLISGGQVVWQTGFDYEVGAASYYIDGTPHTSAQQTVTVGAADATFDRIDVIALDATGTAVVIAGTPSAAPAEPVVDPGTHLKLSSVIVTAASSGASVVVTSIYAENVEWTTSTNAPGRISFTDASAPRAGTKAIKGTAAQSGDRMEFLAPGPVDLSAQDKLVLYVRLTAAWPKQRRLRVSWLSGSTVKGAVLVLSNGSYGLDFNTVGSYQLVVIPTTGFGVPAGVTVDKLRLEIAGSGATVGFLVDDVQLQAGVDVPGSAIRALYRGAWSASVSYQVNDIVLVSGTTYIALVDNLNATPASSPTIWAPLGGTGGGGSLADGDYGDISVSGGGTALTIDPDAVTYGKIQNVSATDKLLGRSTAGAGDIEEIPCTAAARSVLDDVSTSAMRATLGVVIGTDVQAHDADLDAIAALTSAADKLPYATGAGAWALTALTAFIRTLLDDVDASAARTTLGLGTAATISATAGGDLAGTLPNPTVAKIHETSGPTALTIGTITDGEFLKRVGATLVSGNPGSAPTGAAAGDLAGTYPNPTIKADVALGGNPTTTTQASSDDSTRVATTAFVQALFTALRNGVSSAFDTLSEIATELGLKAPLASPALTGTPTVPTAATGTSTIQAASTAFVQQEIAANTSGAPANAQYVTLALSGSLSAERVLAAGPGISITDAGANGNVTVAATGATLSTKTANYTAQTADGTLAGDASGGAFTITLYAASGNSGRTLTIRKVDGTVNAVTIDGNSSETISGALTKILNLPGDWVRIQCDGSNWIVVEQGRPNYDAYKWPSSFGHTPNTTANTTLNISAPTGSGTPLASQDADAGAWVKPQSSTALGNTAGWISPFTHGRRDRLSDFVTVCKPDGLTGIGIWVGWFSATPDNNSDPAAHIAAFRYYTSVDGTAFWRTVTKDGTTATVTTTSVAITDATKYVLRIEMSAADVKFWINDILVAEHTTNLPGASTELAFAFRNTNLVGGVGTAVACKHSKSVMASLG